MQKDFGGFPLVYEVDIHKMPKGETLHIAVKSKYRVLAWDSSGFVLSAPGRSEQR